MRGVIRRGTEQYDVDHATSPVRDRMFIDSGPRCWASSMGTQCFRLIDATLSPVPQGAKYFTVDGSLKSWQFPKERNVADANWRLQHFAPQELLFLDCLLYLKTRGSFRTGGWLPLGRLAWQITAQLHLVPLCGCESRHPFALRIFCRHQTCRSAQFS